MTFCNCHVQFPLELVARLFHAAVSESVVVYPPPARGIKVSMDEVDLVV